MHRQAFPDRSLSGKVFHKALAAEDNRLFICATTSLYASYVNVTGVPDP